MLPLHRFYDQALRLAAIQIALPIRKRNSLLFPGQNKVWKCFNQLMRENILRTRLMAIGQSEKTAVIVFGRVWPKWTRAMFPPNNPSSFIFLSMNKFFLFLFHVTFRFVMLLN